MHEQTRERFGSRPERSSALRRTGCILVVASMLLTAATACDERAAVPLAARPTAENKQGITDPVLRAERALAIRETALSYGITSGVLFAGIGQAETGLSHCNSEVGYGCPGPPSPDCGDGPILAGGADGPCADEQGGLGMFQFDAGTYADTLALYGPEVLTFSGNVAYAMEFMIERIRISTYVDGVDTSEEAVAWINTVYPGSPNYDAWITSVTHYYNGCVPGQCSLFDGRYAGYSDATYMLLDEMGADFWDVMPAPCLAIPPEGGVIEENDPCFERSGTPSSWYAYAGGSDGALLFTYSWGDGPPDNVGTWRVNVTQAGAYDLDVYTDSHAQSVQARYVIALNGTLDEVVVDQTMVDGYQRLGTYTLSPSTELTVSLADATGEPYDNASTRVVFDALRVGPATAAVPPDGGPSEPDSGPADGGASEPEPDVPDAGMGGDGAPADGGVNANGDVDSGALGPSVAPTPFGCSHAGLSAPTPMVAMTMVISLLCWTRRRRTA